MTNNYVNDVKFTVCDVVNLKACLVKCLVVTVRRTNNVRHKGDNVRGTIVIVCAVLTYFVSNILI
jgi:hypothetical protein